METEIDTRIDTGALPAPNGENPAPDTRPTAEPTDNITQHPDNSAPSPEQLAAIIAEAEQRGYLRGRNEQIALAMKSPALWQETDTGSPDHTDDLQPAILANIRPSIWD